MMLLRETFEKMISESDNSGMKPHPKENGIKSCREGWIKKATKHSKGGLQWLDHDLGITLWGK